MQRHLECALLKMKYKLRNSNGLEFDVSVKEDIKKLMNWSEEDFEKYTIKKEEDVSFGDKYFRIIVKDGCMTIFSNSKSEDTFVGKVDGFRFQNLKIAMEKMENE